MALSRAHPRLGMPRGTRGETLVVVYLSVLPVSVAFASSSAEMAFYPPGQSCPCSSNAKALRAELYAPLNWAFLELWRRQVHCFGEFLSGFKSVTLIRPQDSSMIAQ
jgi:hypothetical protein